MLLLCRSHHIAVHEHHLVITRSAQPFTGAMKASGGFDFATQAGTRLVPPDDPGEVVLAFETATVDHGAPVDPERISTLGGGEGFNLGECVRWLFDAARLHRQRTGPDDEATASTSAA
jgi:hypothetical protein